MSRPPYRPDYLTKLNDDVLEARWPASLSDGFSVSWSSYVSNG